MIHFLLFLLCSLGFALLCLARDRHQRDLLGRKLAPPQAAMLRRGGWGCLLLAYAAAGIALGWGYGTIEWLGQLSAGALLTVLILASRSETRASRR
ncbi:DUF3325 domain-containing protein [Sphingopyxis sp. NJF-3]